MITTGSGLERFHHCLGSSVLPRAFDETDNDDKTHGVEAHAYLERVGEGMKPEEALELVDERFRASIAEIELEPLRDVLGLTAELSLAYNPRFDTARVLGMGLRREYVAAGCTEDEIPLTIDVAGVDHPDSPRVGICVDWKRGWGRQTPAERNWQLRGGVLALSRVYDLEEGRAQLIQLRENLPARRDTAVFTAADLARFAAQTRARWDEAMRAREAYERTKIDPEVTKGSWCKFCPSYGACHGQMSLIRAAVTRENYEDLTRDGSISDVALAYRFLRDVEEPLARAWKQVYAAAKERPALIETLEDGTQVWLGITEVEGNLKLDATKARAVVRELLGMKRNDGTESDPAEEISLYTVSQDRIETACKARVPKGKGAEKMREVMAELKRRGGAKNPVKHEVDLYKIRPQQRAMKAG